MKAEFDLLDMNMGPSIEQKEDKNKKDKIIPQIVNFSDLLGGTVTESPNKI